MIVHRVRGVDAQVHHDLHDLRGAGEDGGTTFRYAALKSQLDRWWQRSTQQGERLAHLGYNIDWHGIVRLVARKVEHSEDEIARAEAATDDGRDILFRF